MNSYGKVVKINGNLVTARLEGSVLMNELAFILHEEQKLKAEVIRIRGDEADLQVFERTQGLILNSWVEFSGSLLYVDLGPGLLGQIYDGLQNPLPLLAEKTGFFLERGVYLEPLDSKKLWNFHPKVNVGDLVEAAWPLGYVKEKHFDHAIMVPFDLKGTYTVHSIKAGGEYTIKDTVAELRDKKGNLIPLMMIFRWPVKHSIELYKEKLMPKDPMITKVRVIDTFIPVAKGGTFCTPGPFGAGKTVLQQVISKNADVDIVIIVACGERAGEVVETLKEFPELIDPKTGRSLMERTIIICNTSSMPVAAREASVYTGTTLAEYYRQMGLDVLLLADSTSRWAQALREVSGRLEEIPGEEAFPAYLESTIAAFYERAGRVLLKTGKTGSVTLGGNVSPAGGNFEEPVTQATLKVVGAFHGLSRERSDARKYPALNILDSFSQYPGVIDSKKVDLAWSFLKQGHEVYQMTKVVGQEGVSLEDYVVYLKSELIDDVYLQQNSFDPVDAAVPVERQTEVFGFLHRVLGNHYRLRGKSEARKFFNQIRQAFINYNLCAWDSANLKGHRVVLESLIGSQIEDAGVSHEKSIQ